MNDFVIISTADWDHPLWTNKQHVACSLADLGNRVLYVESLGIRSVQITRASDWTKIKRRIFRALWPLRQVSPRIWVLSPLVIPGGSDGWSLRVNKLSLVLALALAQAHIGLRQPLLWTFNPLTRRYLNLKMFRSTIYHCVDRIQAQPGMPVELLDLEEKSLCQESQVVFTTAPYLQEGLQALNPATYLFGNVADEAHFAQALEPSLPRPVDCPSSERPLVMFIGAIDAYKLDLLLLEELIQDTPQWTYLLIGPIAETDSSTEISGLHGLPNVYLIGSRPYRDLPAYLACADVALLPLQINDYTRHMYPMKFFEYLAAGCPVVATAIPSLHDQSDVAWLCDPSCQSFKQSIQEALEAKGASRQQRLERASMHTYQRRTEAMLERLDFHGLLLPATGATTHMPNARPLSRQALESLTVSLLVLLIGALRLLNQNFLSGALRNACLKRWSRNTRLLYLAADDAIRSGDMREARHYMEALWRENGQVLTLHHLLLKPRRGQVVDQLALFETMMISDVFPLYFTGYCAVILGDWSIEIKDPDLRDGCLNTLTTVITTLLDDPGTYHCLRPVHENRMQLLVSTQRSRMRLLMADQFWLELEACGPDLMRSLADYNPALIDPQSASRLTTNAVRCLAMEGLMAWWTNDAQRFLAAFSEVHRLVEAADSLSFDSDSLGGQTDARAFAALMLKQLRGCLWRADLGQQRPGRGQLVGFVLLILNNHLNWKRSDKVQRLLKTLEQTKPA